MPPEIAPPCPLCKEGKGIPRVLAPGEDPLSIITTRVCDKCGHEWKVEGEKPLPPHSVT